MAVLFTGGSFTKVRQMFLHMSLACVSLNTFFKHQRVSDSFEITSKLILSTVSKRLQCMYRCDSWSQFEQAITCMLQSI